MNANAFLPDNYEAPSTGSGRYMKLNPGENRFRILSKPLIGFEYWNTSNKPVRMVMRPTTLPADIREDKYGKKEIRHFWAMVVFNYATAQIEILQINQASIQKAIADFSMDKDWGNPFAYDLKITKTGADKETKYVVAPVPHREVDQVVKDAYKATPVNLDALLSGGDPFAGAPAAPVMAAAQPQAQPAPAPAPEPAVAPAVAAGAAALGVPAHTGGLPF